MNRSDRAIQASYAFCRHMARQSGSSFYPSFLLLPEPKRRAMDALYAFTRHTDDLTDNPQPVEARREALARWRGSLEAALLGQGGVGSWERGVGSGDSGVGSGERKVGRVEWTAGSGEQRAGSRKLPIESRDIRCSRRFSCFSQLLSPFSQLLSPFSSLARPLPFAPHPSAAHPSPGEALLPALADSVERFQIPPEHLLAVVDGVAMDLDRPSYETFDDLAAYCERVASAVGLACIHIWGFRGEQAFEPARKCGIALQITNILRDLQEDAEQGRVYLPREDLRRWGYSAEDLAAGVVDDRFERLIEFEIDRARRFYHEGAELFEWLHRDGRRVFGMMMAVYYRLLKQIAAGPGEVLRRRMGLSRWQKLGIAARWSLLPPRRSALP